MRYFIDTEFVEGFHKPLFGKRRHFIDLISIGIVAEDGREYYAISSEYDYHKADTWVKENVIHPLYQETVVGDNRNHFDAGKFHKFYGKPNELIAEEIFEFCTQDTIGLEKAKYYNISYENRDIEFYAYFANYDWVVFCSLFGRMSDWPKGFPMYCRDLKQTLDEKVSTNTLSFYKFGNEYSLSDRLSITKESNDYPKQSNEHNALADARWNFELHKFLTR